MLLQRSILLASLLLAVASAGKLKGVNSNNDKSVRRLNKKKVRGPQYRDCDVSAKDDKVDFSCKSRSAHPKGHDNNPDLQPEDRGISIVPDAEIKDKIKYKIHTKDEGISVKLEYKNEIEMDDTETETKTKFELLFMELVEYVKAVDGDSDSEAYDWEEDEIVQTIPLTQWMDIPGVIDDEEGVISYFTATTLPLSDQGGTAAFNFTISRADQGESVTANSMKIDVRILDFPWSRTDSYLALMSTLKSEKKVKVFYDDEATVTADGDKPHHHAKKPKDVVISFGDENLEETFGFSTYGQYTWADQAEATVVEVPFNGTVMTSRQGDVSDSLIMVDEDTNATTTKSTIEVIATSPENVENEAVKQIAYSFVGEAAQGASDLYWDPEAGIGYESGVRRNGLMMGLIGTAAVALLSVLA